MDAPVAYPRASGRESARPRAGAVTGDAIEGLILRARTIPACGHAPSYGRPWRCWIRCASDPGDPAHRRHHHVRGGGEDDDRDQDEMRDIGGMHAHRQRDHRVAADAFNPGWRFRGRLPARGWRHRPGAACAIASCRSGRCVPPAGAYRAARRRSRRYGCCPFPCAARRRPAPPCVRDARSVRRLAFRHRRSRRNAPPRRRASCAAQ